MVDQRCCGIDYDGPIVRDGCLGARKSVYGLCETPPKMAERVTLEAVHTEVCKVPTPSPRNKSSPATVYRTIHIRISNKTKLKTLSTTYTICLLLVVKYRPPHGPRRKQ